jgi:hypothetical protein
VASGFTGPAMGSPKGGHHVLFVTVGLPAFAEGYGASAEA